MFAAFNTAEKERSKLSDLLTQSQDKALRRISELKEQNELNKKSKIDLETSLTQKDEEISKLQTQVKTRYKFARILRRYWFKVIWIVIELHVRYALPYLMAYGNHLWVLSNPLWLLCFQYNLKALCFVKCIPPDSIAS